MNVALVQYNPVWEDKQENKLKIEEIFRSMEQKSDLSIFPELTLTGFTMRARKFAEPISGESMIFFQSLAKNFNTHVMFGFIEEDNNSYFNTLVHLNQRGELVNKYHKIHPFSFSGEHRFYQADDKTVISSLDNFKIGLTICYDLRFPELYRIYGKAKTEIIVNIANWPRQRIQHWHILLQARAIENQCYMVGVNRVGSDKTHQYNGQSMVVGPFGNKLVNPSSDEMVCHAQLMLQDVVEIRKKYPFLEDIKLT
jgi:predicted amidohydrolase